MSAMKIQSIKRLARKSGLFHRASDETGSRKPTSNGVTMAVNSRAMDVTMSQ